MNLEKESHGRGKMKVPGGWCQRCSSSVRIEKHPTSSGGASEKRSIFARIRSLKGSGTDGSALVEMAVTLPLMMLIMTGIFSFSIALYQKLELAEAVSNGGRVLAVDRGDIDPCSTVASAIYATTPSLNKANLTLTFVLNGVSTGPSCSGIGASPNSNMVQGGTAQVSASYTCSIGVYGLNYPGCTLGTQIAELVQ
jgi:TadE-like protein